ncbi:MAG: hypothetical protein IT175_18150 [Acidobacteria bacterium]|nr:hypothetical protein [Acidobacteriota bacterium]
MRRRNLHRALILGIGFSFLALTCAPAVPAQEGEFKSMRIESIAQGTGTQLGQIIRVDITIRELSTTEERDALIAAFKAKGSTGLGRALSKMPSRGRISVTGTLGYDINYARIVQTPSGLKLRFVTDRAISFREAWYDTRSRDYDLSAGEIDLTNADGDGTGTLMPACMFTIGKDNQVEIELRRNAWKLTSVKVHQ